MTTTGTESAEVLSTIRKTADLETHVRLVEVDGVSVLELRDYIPSLKEYGRGYWIPADGATVSQLAQALLLASARP